MAQRTSSKCTSFLFAIFLCLLVLALPRKSFSEGRIIHQTPLARKEPCHPASRLFRSKMPGNFTGSSYTHRGIHVVGDNRLLICQIRKAASRVMAQLEARVDGQLFWHSGDLADIHAYDFLKDEESRNLHMTEEDRPPSVVMVRNPATRILSAYISKLENKNDDFEYCWDDSCPEEIGSFAELIEALEDANMSLVNKHFTPQWMECGFEEGLTYDCIVSYEHRAREWRQCMTKLGLWREFGMTGWGPKGNEAFFEDSEILFHNQYVKKTSVTDDPDLMQSYYTHTLLEKVFKIYERDFELLGYSMDASHYLQNITA